MKVIRIRPENHGLRATLFDLQADVMEVIWSNGWESFTVADVHLELECSRDIAYTTVMTTVSRLHEMGLLNRSRDGKRYVYQAAMSREAYQRALVRDIFQSLPETSREVALAFLIDQVSEADEGALNQLSAMIRARREGLES